MIVRFVEVVNKIVGDIQRGFSSARVDVGGRSPVVIYKVGNTIYSEPHLPALWKRLLIQQSKNKRELHQHSVMDYFRTTQKDIF